MCRKHNRPIEQETADAGEKEGEEESVVAPETVIHRLCGKFDFAKDLSKINSIKIAGEESKATQQRQHHESVVEENAIRAQILRLELLLGEDAIRRGAYVVE